MSREINICRKDNTWNRGHIKILFHARPDTASVGDNGEAIAITNSAGRTKLKTISDELPLTMLPITDVEKLTLLQLWRVGAHTLAHTHAHTCMHKHVQQ